jgi:Holliday junction resolvase-like predicted endonuclease
MDGKILTGANMAGKATRNKGKEGQRQAKALLKDRDWTIIADTSAGLATGDLIVESPEGIRYDVEVKNRREVHVPCFIGQARKSAEATKSAWMVLAKLDGFASWLVLRKGEKPTVWHQKQ